MVCTTNVMYEKYLNKESRDILPLITLKLDNLSSLQIFCGVRRLNIKLKERKLVNYTQGAFEIERACSPGPALGLAQQYHCSKTPF